MISHSALAKKNFENGCNCAQAVLLAFSDITGLDDAAALRIASSFGAGMGRLREVCGALTGVFMAAGLFCGYEKPGDDAQKAAHYARIQDLAFQFQEKFSTFICRELLELELRHDDPVPEKRTPEYYQKRKCALYVEYAAALFDEYLDCISEK